MNDILRPKWLPVSALVFGRIDSLRPSNADEPAPIKVGDLMPRLLAATEPRDMSREELESWTDDDTDAGVPTFGSNSGASDPLPGPRNVGVRTRLALLRLCAAIGDVTRLTHMGKAGTVTLVQGVPLDGFDAVVKLMRGEVISLGRSLAGGATARKPVAVPETVVLTPHVSDSTISGREMARIDAEFASALEGKAPILIVLPAGTMPSRSLLTASPLRIALAPLDRAILLQIFAKTHPPLVKANARAIIGRMPADDALAGVTDIALLSALRMGDPRRVADDLTARCERPIGPRLADLPDGPAVRAARTLISDLKAWRDGKATWDEIPHSLLLYGPAGTGKSTIARAMACEPGLRFVTASFAAWQRCGHLGDMLRAMNASFAEAMAMAPCILFIDEIDSAGSRSGADGHGKDYRRQVINAFLVGIDDLNAAGGVILVGACNDPQALDPAILRPGRFDHKVEVPLPDRAALASVLARGLGPAVTATEIGHVSRRLIGETMASVDAMIRAAKSTARAAGRALSLADVEAQIPGPGPNPAVAWRVAVHEAGHAIVAHHVRQGRVTRVSLGNGTGAMERRLEIGEGLEPEFADHLAVHMAGRAAERIVLGTVSGGAGGSQDSDLAQATRLAGMMETRFGFGASGPVWIEHPRMGDAASHAPIRARLEEAEARAAQIITTYHAKLLDLAEALVAEGELSGARLDALLADAAPPDALSDAQDFPMAC